MLDLSELSQENLEKIQKVLKIILDYLEFGFNELTGIAKVPLKKFEKEDIFYEEVVSIIRKIHREESNIEIIDESIILSSGDFSSEIEGLRELEKLEKETIGLKFWDISKKDLKENIILRIKNLDRLKEIKRGVDKKIKENERIVEKEGRQPVELLKRCLMKS